VSPDLLEAPPTEIRQQIKRHMLDGEWDKALEAAESAMALPCGRGWLDLQRYVVRACAELGSEYNAIAAAVQSELRALLKDFPGLPEMTLMDDTATANAETQAWLSELTPAAPAASSSDAFETAVSMEQDEEEPVAESVGDEPADPFDLAMEEARAGNGERAMQILTRQISQERSGRGRFMRRKQLAQVCIFLDLHAIAYPIL
jgi:type VI secretion system protein ImpA